MNSVERIVATSLEQFKNDSAGLNETCWCPACEVDIMALSLTRLPPSYHTRFDNEKQLEEKELDNVQRVIEDAAGRVARFPRHDRVTSSPGRVRLINFNVEEGTKIVNVLIKQSALPCDCQKCCTDILTYSLNRVKPRYGVERAGQVDLPQEEKEEIRQRVAIMIALASGVVVGRPSHQ